MNDNHRSPLWDKKLTFIGILIAVMIAATFILFNFNNKRYSDVKAATAMQPTTEVTTESTIIVETIPVEKPKYTCEYTGEEKARIAHKNIVYDEYEGIPDSERQKIIAIKAEEKTREEVDDPQTDNISFSNTTPEQQIIEDEVIEEPEEIASSSDSMGTYYGCLELTAYTWTGNPCADGIYPSSGYTVACNNSDLWHHWIYIEGYGNYYVHDTGGMGHGVIDVYMDSYDVCIQFGRRSANIYIID